MVIHLSNLSIGMRYSWNLIPLFAVNILDLAPKKESIQVRAKLTSTVITQSCKFFISFSSFIQTHPLILLFSLLVAIYKLLNWQTADSVGEILKWFDSTDYNEISRVSP